MLRSSIQAAVTMGQLQKRLDLIGNNMANSQTPGYKSRQADFASLLIQQINNQEREGDTTRLTPDGIRIGTGAQLGHTDINQTQGSIKQTGRSLDVAMLSQNHLFQVQVGDETQYTRDGSFYLQPMDNQTETMLVTSNGDPVIGENGPIRLDNNFDQININQDGSILVERRGTQAVEARLGVVEAVRPRLLEAAGENNFTLPDLNALGYNQGEIIQGVGQTNVTLQSGALEASNVDIGKQMTEMLMTQRAYQFNGKSISTGDQMMGLINNLR